MPVNAVDLLMDDHEEARALFAEVEEGGPETEDAFHELARALEIHVRLEKELFYPRIQEAIGPHLPQELLDLQGEEENDAMALLENLVAMGVEHGDFRSRFAQLRAMVERHALEDEDQGIFPIALQRMTDDQLEALGEEMERMRERLEDEVELAP